MTPLNQLKAVEYGLESTAPVSVSQPASGMRSLFLGPRGLRAGWRLLIFIGLLVVMFVGAVLVRHGGPQSVRNAQKHLGEVTITPFLMGVSEAISFAILCLATLVMGRIENRKFSEYGLALRKALGKDFWIGCLSGFLAISGTLLAMLSSTDSALPASLSMGRQFSMRSPGGQSPSSWWDCSKNS
jgi:hypothetical protein